MTIGTSLEKVFEWWYVWTFYCIMRLVAAQDIFILIDDSFIVFPYNCFSNIIKVLCLLITGKLDPALHRAAKTAIKADH